MTPRLLVDLSQELYNRRRRQNVAKLWMGPYEVQTAKVFLGAMLLDCTLLEVWVSVLRASLFQCSQRLAFQKIRLRRFP